MRLADVNMLFRTNAINPALAIPAYKQVKPLWGRSDAWKSITPGGDAVYQVGKLTVTKDGSPLFCSYAPLRGSVSSGNSMFLVAAIRPMYANNVPLISEATNSGLIRDFWEQVRTGRMFIDADIRETAYGLQCFHYTRILHRRVAIFHTPPKTVLAAGVIPILQLDGVSVALRDALDSVVSEFFRNMSRGDSLYNVVSNGLLQLIPEKEQRLLYSTTADIRALREYDEFELAQ